MSEARDPEAGAERKAAAAVVTHKGVTVTIYGPLADRKQEVFLLTYYSGLKRKKETSKGSPELAKKKAKEICAGIGTGDVIDALHMTPLDRRVYLTAKEAAAPTGRPVDQLCRESARAIAKLPAGVSLEAATDYYNLQHGSKLPEISPAELWEELKLWLGAKRRSDTTVQSLKKLLKPFLRDFQVPIAHIRTEDLDAWMAKRMDLGSRSLDNQRAALVRLFNFAKGRYLPDDTKTAAERLIPPSEERGAVEIFRPWELTKLMAAAPEDLLPCIALGAFAGLRTIELVRIEWSAIRFADEPGEPESEKDVTKPKYPHGFIVVDKAIAKQHRTAARRIIPIQENLAEWLRPYRFRAGPISPIRKDKYLSTAITKIIRAVNKVEKKARRPLLNRPKNGCRHSYASYRLPVLEDAAALSIEMNNSVREIIKDYSELVMPRDVEAYWKIAPIQPAKIVQIEMFG